MLQNRYGNVGPAALKTQRPITSDDEHRVLKFRPRTSAQPPGRPTPQNSAHEADDLSHFERARDEPDDFRHRMLANIAAFAFTVALTENFQVVCFEVEHWKVIVCFLNLLCTVLV